MTTHRLRDVALVLTSNVDKVIDPDENPVRLCNYVDVYKNNFIQNEMPFKPGSATAAEIKKFRVEVDDVIITKDSETADDIGVPALVKSTGDDLVCGYHLSILRADRRRMIGPFLYWHLLSKKTQEDFGNAANGVTRYGLTLGGIKGIPINVPDLETQRQIADFLDRETARIDLLIDKKQRLVALLGEQWESVVEEAISTGGQATKLGHHIDVLSGYAFPSSDFSTDPDDIPLLRGANVAPGSIRWADTVYWPRERLNEVSRFLLKAGDVVLGMDRPWISSGIRVAELSATDAPALLLQRVCRITPRKTLDKDFMRLLLTSRRFLAYFEPIMTGVSVPHISPDQVGSFRFEFAEMTEQAARASAAVCKRKKMDAVREQTDQSIDRLKEYRSALITAAVTGQIDVQTYGKSGTVDRRLDAIQEEMEA